MQIAPRADIWPAGHASTPRSAKSCSTSRLCRWGSEFGATSAASRSGQYFNATTLTHDEAVAQSDRHSKRRFVSSTGALRAGRVTCLRWQLMELDRYESMRTPHL